MLTHGIISSILDWVYEGGIHGIYEFIDKHKSLIGLNSTSRSLSSTPYRLESLPGPIGYQNVPTSLARQRSADFVRKSMFSIDDEDDDEEGESNERHRMITSPTQTSATSEGEQSKGEIAYSILSKRRNHWDDADYVGLIDSYDATWAERSAHSLT